MTLMYVTTTETIAACVNWGRWVVRCLRCPSALTLPYGADLFRCDDCGCRAEIEWPGEEMAYGICRLLAMRPLLHTRNWEPGETLPMLAMENGAHGVLNPLLVDDPGNILLTVHDDAIVRDLLPAVGHQRKEVSA